MVFTKILYAQEIRSTPLYDAIFSYPSEGGGELRFTNKTSIELLLLSYKVKFSCDDGSAKEAIFFPEFQGVKKYKHFSVFGPGMTFTGTSQASNPCNGRIVKEELLDLPVQQMGLIGLGKIPCGDDESFVSIEMVGEGESFLFKSTSGAQATIPATGEGIEQFISSSCKSSELGQHQISLNGMKQYVSSWAQYCQNDPSQCVNIYNQTHRSKYILVDQPVPQLEETGEIKGSEVVSATKGTNGGKSSPDMSEDRVGGASGDSLNNTPAYFRQAPKRLISEFDNVQESDCGKDNHYDLCKCSCESVVLNDLRHVRSDAVKACKAGCEATVWNFLWGFDDYVGNPVHCEKGDARVEQQCRDKLKSEGFVSTDFNAYCIQGYEKYKEFAGCKDFLK